VAEVREFDLGSFLWGMLVGGIVTAGVAAAAIYFAWPYIVKAIGAAEIARTIREVLGG